MFGYKDQDELFHDCSAYHRVEDISIPVIAVNSADDPLCPPDSKFTLLPPQDNCVAISQLYLLQALCYVSSGELILLDGWFINSLLFSNPAIPEDRARRNPNLILVTTSRGGQIGFMDSLLPFGKCFIDRVVIQFAEVSLKYDALWVEPRFGRTCVVDVVCV